MSKKTFKEVVIAMLLCIVIILVTALALYNYVPSNKELPAVVAYTTPNEIEEELADSTDGEGIVLTYEVDDADMSNYERINSYNPGKTNPFESFSEENDTQVKTTSTASKTSASKNPEVSETTTVADSGNSKTTTSSNYGGEEGYYNYKNGK